MPDQLVSGRAFRVLTVIDNWSRESVLLEVGFRLKGQSVADALDRVGKAPKLPGTLAVDFQTGLPIAVLMPSTFSSQ